MDQTQLEELAQTGIAALNKGDAAQALPAFLTIADAGRATPRLWAMIADAAERLANNLREAAAWRGLESIVIEDWGDAAADLRKIFG